MIFCTHDCMMNVIYSLNFVWYNGGSKINNRHKDKKLFFTKENKLTNPKNKDLKLLVYLYLYNFEHGNTVTQLETHINIKCYVINQSYSEYKISVFHLDFGDWTTLYETTFSLNLNFILD